MWHVVRTLSVGQIEHSALTPKSSDARKKFIRLARQYQVETIVLGKHGKADVNPLSAVQGYPERYFISIYLSIHPSIHPSIYLSIY